MMLPVAGSDPQYRERVYCYELYHQTRCQWDPNFEFSLCGEIDKRNHEYVRGKHLHNIKPDFLIHRPGQMDSASNLLAIEVKPAVAYEEQMRADLRKLTALRRDLTNAHNEPANYNHAFFWIYGLPIEAWPGIRSEIFHKGTQDIDTSLIRCFIHEGPGRAITEVFWQ
jgi:hypothetical protein